MSFQKMILEETMDWRTNGGASTEAAGDMRHTAMVIDAELAAIKTRAQARRLAQIYSDAIWRQDTGTAAHLYAAACQAANLFAYGSRRRAKRFLARV